MDSEEPQPFTDDGKEWEFPSGKELGVLLKAKRKEVGLTYAEISERIKVSARYLEALENEDWEHLPSPAFIKGFIRSYARVLGLSEEGLIALYQETAPSQPKPKPLQAAPKKKKWPLCLILVFAVLVGGIGAYEWIGHPTLRENATEQGTTLPAKARSDAAWIDPVRRLEKEESSRNETQKEPDSSKTGEEMLREGPAPAPRPEETGSIDKLADAPQQTEERASSSGTVTSSVAETSVPDIAPASEGDARPLILKASVKERTWVRVTIDNERPKEYTFDPGSSPEWRARGGFELLIGNAGGIDLEYNGKKVEDLGKRGQVIRLKLPSENERNVSSD